MLDKTLHFNFAATGIGSVPFQNIKDTCRDILEHLPAMPFWPQFVKRSYLEDMTIQFSEGLPLLEVIEKKRSLTKLDGHVFQVAAFYKLRPEGQGGRCSKISRQVSSIF